MTFVGTLLPYQEEAVERMIERPQMLVAYDLGLGKTVITIAAIERLRKEGDIDGPVLVVVLASLKFQWAKEIQKFSDSSVIVIDGSKPKRLAQIEQAADYDYIVTNYESVVNDWSILSEISYGALVLDEATAIKGFRSKRSRRVKTLSKGIQIRFALTGTPVENGRPEEIFSIMQAVQPKLLGRFDVFDATFIIRNRWGAPERYRNLDVLHQRLEQNLIRKTQRDQDVSRYLPDTIHRDPQLVQFDKNLRVVYRYVANQLLEELEEAVASFGSNFSLASHYGHAAPNQPPSGQMGSLMARIMLLRQMASHPQLVVESAELFRKNWDLAVSSDSALRTGGSPYALELVEDPELGPLLGKARVPKLDRLDALIRDHLDTDDAAKIVVFTSFLSSASYIQERVGGVTYSGRMSAEEKEAAKVRFQTDPEVRVLISTDAGGYGVDLPQANLLLNYDLPWSSGKAVQRNGRIRRASSRWPSVVIQDLLVESSIEVRQFDLLTQKTTVADAIVDGRGINSAGGVDHSAGSLLEHLRATT